MSVSKKMLKNIEKEAIKIYRDLDIKKPPVSLDSIFRYVEKNFGPIILLKDNCGLLKKRGVYAQVQREGNGCFSIMYNAQDSPHQRDFHILHEIGHILFGSITVNAFRKGIKDDNEEEGICDHFALSILVNPQLLRHHWKVTRDVLSLANFFNTSPAYIRMMAEHLKLI